MIDIEVQNFGQAASESAEIESIFKLNGSTISTASGTVPGLGPFEKATVTMHLSGLKPGVEYNIQITIRTEQQEPVLFQTTWTSQE